MAKSKSKGRTKRRRRRPDGGRRTAGLMVGMRSGFKKAAKGVTGSDQRAKRSPLYGTLVTAALIIAVAAVLFYRS